MAETAAEKKKREEEAKKAAAEKAKAEKKEAEAAQKEAEKNDEKPSNKPQISTKHDEVMKEKLAHGSTKAARQAEAANYQKQQERQAALERETRNGLKADNKDAKK